MAPQTGHAVGGAGCLLGGFIHSSNWDPVAMTHLMRSAARWQLGSLPDASAQPWLQQMWPLKLFSAR
jgi:hypothetical protein